jgi:hypothetical protein
MADRRRVAFRVRILLGLGARAATENQAEVEPLPGVKDGTGSGGTDSYVFYVNVICLGRLFSSIRLDIPPEWMKANTRLRQSDELRINTVPDIHPPQPDAFYSKHCPHPSFTPVGYP